jgi:lanthanide-dependent methanol dehydrogenase
MTAADYTIVPANNLTFKNFPFIGGGTECAKSVGRMICSIRGWLRSVAHVVVALTIVGCQETDDRPTSALGLVTLSKSVGTPSALPTSDDGQWVRPAKDYASTRFSTLSEIDTTNAANLKLAWSYKTGIEKGHEAAPLVVNNTMYVVLPYPNTLIAFDLTKPGANVKWTYRPRTDPASQGPACCDVVNRGASYADGLIVYNTLDNHTVAVDANTGKLVWQARLGDINKGETMTMAPLIVKDKVLVGNSGGEYGVHGWLTALDLRTGKIAWRAYHTGPDSLVLLGSRFKPFYASDQGKDLGVNSWPGLTWMNGGGTTWGWISYDPELDLIYYGTANPGPWNPEQRVGDNKWTSTLFARDPDDGQAVWAYQLSPHDLHDYDGVNEQILLDLPIQGQTRKVLIRPERNGYIYVMDRVTGQVLSADPYVHITTSSGVDLETGRIQYNPKTEPQLGKVVRDICPAAPGAKDWQPSSYSPITGLLYIPHQNLCMDVESVDANYISGTPFVGMTVKMYGGKGGYRGEVSAWDPIARKKVWSIREWFPVWSGTVVTAGDVVFYGTMDGWFKAVSARSGRELWKYKVESGIIGQPVTYKGPDGRQYVAVLAGVGGWSGAIVSGEMDPRDSSVALGFGNAMRDLQKATKKGGRLYVFGL